MDSERFFILGTAGHIDHGKSSLVRALTGTDPDRLPEEKARGMTIELGFAELKIDNTRFGIVDVPGHERFIKTMVSGATGIDLVMLIVAADDSVMPQTTEHVEILRLLGVSRGVVAITKADLVDDDMLDMVREEVADLLKHTPLASAEICPVSSITGRGLVELKSALMRAADQISISSSEHPFRMAVDRVFSVPGRGTVATGSALRGQVTVGDTLEVFPGKAICRVREMQTHGHASSGLRRGQRAALNLTGIEREQIDRGSELATPGFLEETHILDARIECLAGCTHPLKSSASYRIGMGTSDAAVRLVLFETDRLAPGETGFAQLRSGEPLVPVFGQRFILRDPSGLRTVGGGRVLRTVARRRRREFAAQVSALKSLETGALPDRMEEVLRRSGFHRPTDLQLCARTGAELPEIPIVLAQLQSAGRWTKVPGTETFSTPSALADMSDELVNWLRRHHKRQPDVPGRRTDSVLGWLEKVTSKSLAKPLIEWLVRQGTVKRLGDFVCLPEFAPTLSKADEKLLASILERIRTALFAPPNADELAKELQSDRKRVERLLVLAAALGELVRVDQDIYLAVETDRQLRVRLTGLIRERGPITVSEAREALGSSRKYVVPFMEYLDRVGFTVRIEDRRVLASMTE